MSTLRQLRNFCIPWVTTIVLFCFSDAVAQTSYTVTDLGTLHNWNGSCAMAVNNHGWALTQNMLLDPPSNSLASVPLKARDTINIDGVNIDLGTLGGPNENTWMNWGGINDRGEAVGMAETPVPDPDGEDFCGFGTGKTCLPFLWQNSHISALPTLGGNNGSASDINNRGQIAGFAETADTDPGCPPNKITLPVLWEGGQAQPLPTVGHDPDAQAYAINNRGQAVGYSGTCLAAIHAVLWENDTAFPLADFGFPRSNRASGINDLGQVVGRVRSPDGSTFVAALWPNGAKGAVTTLGILPGDSFSWAFGINNQGQVVGSTLILDSTFTLNWSRAFIWQDKVLTDLNTLFPASSNLFATMANKINESGQIVGMGTVLSGPHAGDIHAFLATPVNASVGTSIADVARTHPHSNLPASVNKQLLQRFGVDR